MLYLTWQVTGRGMGDQAEHSLQCCCDYSSSSRITPRATALFLCCVKNVKHNRLANANSVRVQIRSEVLQLVRIWVIACTLFSQHVCGGELSPKTRERAVSL